MTDGVKKIVNHSDPDMGHLIKRAREQGSGFDGVMPKKPESERLMFDDPEFTARFKANGEGIAALRAQLEAGGVGSIQPRPAAQPVGRVNEDGPPIVKG